MNWITKMATSGFAKGVYSTVTGGVIVAGTLVGFDKIYTKVATRNSKIEKVLTEEGPEGLKYYFLQLNVARTPEHAEYMVKQIVKEREKRAANAAAAKATAASA